MPRESGYFTRLLAALLGRQATPSGSDLPEDSTQLASQVASLRLDLEERDQQIAAMRGEYQRLEIAKEHSTATAGDEELTGLMKRLSGPLSNLAVLRDAAEAGEEVQVADLLHLFKSLEKVLHRSGLEVVGRSGETLAFDPSIHQRMSGGHVRSGIMVKVEVPGYRMGERILQKALVSAEGNHDDEDRD